MQLDHGYTLHCSGCGGHRSLTMCELRDMDRTLDIKARMREVHKLCDGFMDVGRAAAAMKARIRAERRAATGGGAK